MAISALSGKHEFVDAHFVFILKCVFAQIVCIVCFVNCVTVSLRPLLASSTDIDRHICLITVSLSLFLPLEFSIKSEDKDGNSLAFQFLPGTKVTLLASKTSRESD